MSFSHFILYNYHNLPSYQLPVFLFVFFLGTKEDAAEILQGLFVFPDSRAVQRGDILISL